MCLVEVSHIFLLVVPVFRVGPRDWTFIHGSCERHITLVPKSLLLHVKARPMSHMLPLTVHRVFKSTSHWGKWKVLRWSRLHRECAQWMSFLQLQCFVRQTWHVILGYVVIMALFLGYLSNWMDLDEITSVGGKVVLFDVI